MEVFMRLDGRKGDRGWYVWHCEELKEINMVVWVDDNISEYATYQDVKNPEDIGIHKAKKIEIIIPSKTIFINPISDNEIDNISLKKIEENV
jgi:hypothetical protein